MAASVASRSVLKSIKRIFTSIDSSQTSIRLHNTSKVHARSSSFPVFGTIRFARPDLNLNTGTIATSVTGQQLLASCKCVPLPPAATRCWKCNIDSTHPNFCEKCGVIQPVRKDINYFEVLGFPVDFNIDIKDLTSRFRQLQRNLHPDKFAQKSEDERAFSEAQSSLVNKSYQTLLKVLPRGLYLLELHGAAMADDEVHLDPRFLMDIMEINERLSESHDIEEIRCISRQNQEMLRDLLTVTREAFALGDIPKAKEALARLTYFVNIDDKVQDFESKMAEQE